MDNSRDKYLWGQEIKKNVMLYPSERIVSFLARNFKKLEENSSKNALDIGFGSGRHMKLLLDYNFNVYGVDYSSECKDAAINILGDNPKLKDLMVDDVKNIKFNQNFFDVIVQWGVIFLVCKKEVQEYLVNARNILKKGGKMIVNFRTKEDFLYGKGNEVEKDTFIINEKGNEYKGMTYSFYNLEEIKEMFCRIGFKINNIEKIEYWKNNLKYKNSWYILEVEK